VDMEPRGFFGERHLRSAAQPPAEETATCRRRKALCLV